MRKVGNECKVCVNVSVNVRGKGSGKPINGWMAHVPVIGEGGVELIVEVAHMVRPLLHPDRRRPIAALLLIAHTCII